MIGQVMIKMSKIEHYGVPGMRKGIRKIKTEQLVTDKKIGSLNGFQSTKVKRLVSNKLQKKPMKKVEVKKASDYIKLKARTKFKTSAIPKKTSKKRSLSHTDVTIEHYGVPGMKWGRRKAAQVKAGYASRKASNAREGQWKDQYRKRASMSNKVLKEKVNRLRLENEFRTLAEAANAPSRARAKQYLNAAKSLPIEALVPNPAAAAVIGGIRRAR